MKSIKQRAAIVWFAVASDHCNPEICVACWKRVNVCTSVWCTRTLDCRICFDCLAVVDEVRGDVNCLVREGANDYIRMTSFLRIIKSNAWISTGKGVPCAWCASNIKAGKSCIAWDIIGGGVYPRTHISCTDTIDNLIQRGKFWICVNRMVWQLPIVRDVQCQIAKFLTLCVDDIAGCAAADLM